MFINHAYMQLLAIIISIVLIKLLLLKLYSVTYNGKQKGYT